MRTLAIDLGTKRIGLAMSDQGGQFASPMPMIEVTDPRQAIEPIAGIVNAEGVERIVLGLPLNMNDTLGAQARSVIVWSGELAKRTPAPIVFVDERLSSFEAEQRLITAKRAGAKITRKDRKQAIDSLAAAGFLQSFLDGGLVAIDPANFTSR